uniref:Aldehyde oxidase/xanthine dehydrogenase second molybdopterin binding domain-containing protein n=1 Tax=Aegilops tauschii subsp. strangulata TaxID=200361 RepID=A0A453M0T4_AEGTS
MDQVEGAFVQGVGFFTNEDYATNADGLVVNDGTWTYKIPTVDTIPKQFNVEFINSARDQKRVLSSKASGHQGGQEGIQGQLAADVPDGRAGNHGRRQGAVRPRRRREAPSEPHFRRRQRRS